MEVSTRESLYSQNFLSISITFLLSDNFNIVFSLGPHNETCGNIDIDLDSPTVIVTNSSSNASKSRVRLWSYALCPLENECENGHNNCSREHAEICVDREEGYDCQCKTGHNKING